MIMYSFIGTSSCTRFTVSKGMKAKLIITYMSNGQPPMYANSSPNLRKALEFQKILTATATAL